MEVKNKIVDKEIAKKLIAIEGQIRGMDLKADAEFVLKKDGREGLEKVKEKLKEVGFPIEYEKVNPLDFYPGGLKAISLLAIKTALAYEDEDIVAMGELAPRISLIVKVFTKYFGSARFWFFQEGPKIWQRYWTVGELVPIQIDEKEKFATLQFRNLSLHPVYCTYLRGYLITMAKMLFGSEIATCQETKCTFKGDKFHEFLIKWH